MTWNRISVYRELARTEQASLLGGDCDNAGNLQCKSVKDVRDLHGGFLFLMFELKRKAELLVRVIQECKSRSGAVKSVQAGDGLPFLYLFDGPAAEAHLLDFLQR